MKTLVPAGARSLAVAVRCTHTETQPRTALRRAPREHLREVAQRALSVHQIRQLSRERAAHAEEHRDGRRRGGAGERVVRADGRDLRGVAGAGADEVDGVADDVGVRGDEGVGEAGAQDTDVRVGCGGEEGDGVVAGGCARGEAEGSGVRNEGAGRVVGAGDELRDGDLRGEEGALGDEALGAEGIVEVLLARLVAVGPLGGVVERGRRGGSARDRGGARRGRATCSCSGGARSRVPCCRGRRPRGTSVSR